MIQLFHPLCLCLAFGSPHCSSSVFLLQTALWSSLASTELDPLFPKQCNNLLSWEKVASYQCRKSTFPWTFVFLDRCVRVTQQGVYSPKASSLQFSVVSFLCLRQTCRILPVFVFCLACLWVWVTWRLMVKKMWKYGKLPQCVVEVFEVFEDHASFAVVCQ